jgi:hypothetical protein
MKQTDKNVIAPDQKMMGIAENITAYLAEFGFLHYGKTSDKKVYARPIADSDSNFLFLFSDGVHIDLREGIRRNGNIRGVQLYECHIKSLHKVIDYLNEQNYL